MKRTVNGAEFRDSLQKVLHFYCETQRFQNAIPVFHFLDFYHGKLAFPHSRNRVQESLCFPMKMGWDFTGILEIRSISIAKHTGSRARIPHPIFFT